MSIEAAPPARERVDSHVHLWEPARLSIPWLSGSPLLDRPFLLGDYRDATAATPVSAFVAVEANATPALAEAQWLVELARAEPRLQGVVAAAPLEQGEGVRPHLEALAQLGPLLKGVRRLLQGEPDPAFCLRPAFLAGVRLLPAFGFSFDLCLTHAQLPAATALVERCPETSFVLDHLGKPPVKLGQLDPWRAQIAQLATLPNVVCKLSGLVTEADHAGWTPDALRPYVDHVLAAFGAERVLFGSDWPVALLASSYERWVTTLELLTAQLSPAEQHQLWCANARRVYRLDQQKAEPRDVSP